ncbi:Exonuclease 1 [Stylophora pistillata]|uniref:Exonuclease 1 n=1 Tax=Stylophora pistillata TaxID=50429 RepID=A0A2B4R7Q0_STYPI|nr:Exonuclease 1 [Stylophora pistillata]
MATETKTRGRVWEHKETLLLLEKWGDENIQLKLKSCRRKKSIWLEIAAYLRAAGYEDRDDSSCKTRIHTLISAYRSYKDECTKTGNATSKKKPAFFDEVDQLMSDKPCTKRKAIIKSATISIDGDGDGEETKAENVEPNLNIPGSSNERVQDICSSYSELMDRNNITPLIVFDGLLLPGKKEGHEKRARLWAGNKDKAEILYRIGMVAEGNKLLAAASGVEHSMVLGFIEICRKKSIDYVVAPYEADAELAFLLTQGHADFVISEDSDLLAYGCKKVLFKLKLSGQCQLIELDKALQHLQLSQKNFLNMCIVAGYDYLDSFRGIGINKSRKLISNESNFLSVLQGMSHAPKEYSSEFLKAKAIFLHQMVINPLNGTTVPLMRWEDTPNFQKTKEYHITCGKYPF